MKNQITVDSKIGYYRGKTGKYEWATVIGFEDDSLLMERNEGRWTNKWKEKITDVIEWLKTPSPDWHGPTPRMVLKHKGTNKNYIS